MTYGCQSMVGKIKRLLLKHPKDAFINSQTVAQQWKNLNYPDQPDYEKAIAEYESFIKLLKPHVEEIHFLPQHNKTGLDSIYDQDTVIVTNRGAIL